MQKRPRYSFLRQLLFPYTGQEALTREQGTRVIVSWALFFSLVILVCALPVAVLLNSGSFARLALLLLIAFIASAIIFSASAWFVVFMNNQSARLRQKQKK